MKRVLLQADVRSQSALESMSRWQFYLARLPSPELQVLIGDDVGPFALVDFLWREYAVVGESDGMLKYDGERNGFALRDEKIRQERLERMGFTVVRWGWDDITRRPSQTVERIRAAMARGRRYDDRRAG